ncbi:MAG TPA: hypothetical protein VF502_13505, partial [Stellaceae bacterium]
GYVLVRQQGHMVRTEMRPELLKPATLIGLYYHLLDLKPRPILLSRLTGQGILHELFDDVAEFAATVERDIDDAGVRRHRPTYSRTRRPLERLEEPRFARFAPVLALWGASRGQLPPDLMPVLRRYGLYRRAALLRNPPGTGRLVYEHVGGGYAHGDDACRSFLLIGQDIEMLPDRDFGCWAARSYYACLGDQEPRLESVSAVMRRCDGQRLWSYYDQVLLPWRTHDGMRFVLGIGEVRRRAVAA